jgi:hypothetical protein
MALRHRHPHQMKKALVKKAQTKSKSRKRKVSIGQASHKSIEHLKKQSPPIGGLCHIWFTALIMQR